MPYLLLLLFPFGTRAQVAYSGAGAQEAIAVGDFRLAAAILDSLETVGEVSPNFYLTQGNAHFEAGEPGRAILAYERGLRLRPGHQDLQNNLRYVRREAGITDLDIPDFFLIRAWRSVGAFLGTTTLFTVSILCWWLAVTGVVWWYLRKENMEEKRRFALLPTALGFGLLSLLLFALGHSRSDYLARSDEAILLEEATLRVSPTAEGSVEAQLTEGVRLYITDRVNQYVKVQLADGKTGYLPADRIGTI
ncbi:SH3 domain-containing protein [Neolewinella xylanilytica]|uniref:SH3 domain-containing protein n=1 Tax=Neolewinella xylanilytica TaxID=1514080 RepID=A0A2S6I4F1_9BACT|nr:hypothetical protein [Neolewinella xylanilytica]PPK85941.1 SH3 domain-containing protein [Neolewinella xylanilytica]